jgi:hypothetical protein
MCFINYPSSSLTLEHPQFNPVIIVFLPPKNKGIFSFYRFHTGKRLDKVVTFLLIELDTHSRGIEDFL